MFPMAPASNILLFNTSTAATVNGIFFILNIYDLTIVIIVFVVDMPTAFVPKPPSPEPSRMTKLGRSLMAWAGMMCLG